MRTLTLSKKVTYPGKLLKEKNIKYYPRMNPQKTRVNSLNFGAKGKIQIQAVAGIFGAKKESFIKQKNKVIKWSID
jgi:hypothetical protein